MPSWFYLFQRMLTGRLIPGLVSVPVLGRVQARGARRAPPRIFGKTKTQLLDTVMRSNATICAAVCASAIPMMLYWSHRYVTVLKPEKEEREARERADLLAEGKA